MQSAYDNAECTYTQHTHSDNIYEKINNKDPNEIGLPW